MLLAEYDYDTDIAAQRKEAFDDGVYQKAVETAKKFLAMGLSVEQVADGTGLSVEVIQDLADK